MLKVGDIYLHHIDCPASDCARIVFNNGNFFDSVIVMSDPSKEGRGAKLQLQFLTKPESVEISEKILSKYSLLEMMKMARVKIIPE